MYLRILFCCSIVWVEIEAHHWERKVTEHISTKSPISHSLSICESVCSLYLPISPPLFLSLSHTQFQLQCLSYSFTLQAVSRQLLECPDLKYAKIATIAPPDYKISGLSIWTLWLRASIYHGTRSVEVWSHCKIETIDCGVMKRDGNSVDESSVPFLD